VSLALYDRRLLVVAGKGGVGRTTVAAALALSAARRGKRVLLAQMRSRERLSMLLGGPPVRSEIVRVQPNLWAVNITPEAALREYGIMVLRSAMIERAVLENKLARAFVRAIPGVEDYSMVGKVWFHTTELDHGRPRFDLVIVDGPATGHVITQLQIPDAILEAVPEGPLTHSARSMRDLLRDPARAAAVLVTLAEEMPVNETIELAAQLRARIGVAVGPLVVNQLYPPRFVTGPSARALAALPEPGDDEALEPLLLRARIAMRRRALNDTYLEKLAAALPLPQAQLPYLFAPQFGAPELADLAQRLDAQIAALP
jgi:anion-transporting  ArsA/GET3 family ATPase